MTTDAVATTGGAALALRPDQTDWTDAQYAVLRHMSAEKATKADFDVFLHRCQQLELDPFAGQIHLVEYGGKATIQVGVHGLESIARATADRAGIDFEWEDTLWCGEDGQWRDVWLSSEPPAAAKSVLVRNGKRYPFVAHFAEFVGQRQVWENGRKTGAVETNAMWTKKPAHMIAKCSKAGSLREAFPRQLADVFAAEELAERPPTVVGEVVREDSPPSDLPAVLELVAAATSVDELRGVWAAHAGRLSVADRARLQAECTAATHHLDEVAVAERGDAEVVEPTLTGETDQ